MQNLLVFSELYKGPKTPYLFIGRCTACVCACVCACCVINVIMGAQSTHQSRNCTAAATTRKRPDLGGQCPG